MKVDVRLIAATNRDLRAALEQGTFREDLYYRLNVVPIDIPPLREHKEDIPDLANLFLSRFASLASKSFTGIAPEAMKKLWIFTGRAMCASLKTSSSAPARWPPARRSKPPTSISTPHEPSVQDSAALLPEGKTLDQWEDEIIREAYRRANGNKSQAARLLGLSRNALRYRLEKSASPDDLPSVPRKPPLPLLFGRLPAEWSPQERLARPSILHNFCWLQPIFEIVPRGTSLAP